MTTFLVLSLVLSLVVLVFTVGLLVLPASRAELRLWTLLRVSHWRRWITRRRGTVQPLDAHVTLKMAREDLATLFLLTILHRLSCTRSASF